MAVKTTFKVVGSDNICFDCGMLYGQCRGGNSTMHEGMCVICKEVKTVTEARDYGVRGEFKLSPLQTVQSRKKHNK